MLNIATALTTVSIVLPKTLKLFSAFSFTPKNKDKALNQFIKKYFQKIYLEIRELASGGAQPNLNMQKVKDTMIALPPLEEQKEIVATIEKLFTLCNELESEINQNKTTVDNLMVTVLKESFEN